MKIIKFFACTSSLLATWAGGTGIEQAYHDSSAAARGNAFVATADRASAVHYNPAGLAWLESPEAQIMTLFSRSEVRHENKLGSFQKKYQTAQTGSLFAAYPGLVGGNLALGLGVTVPHGLGIEWDDSSLLRSLGTEGYLLHAVVSPTASWKLNDHLSMGVSLNYAHDELELRQGLVAVGDSFQYEGSGDGWGASVGMLYRPSEEWSIGLTYRSAIRTYLDGEAVTRTIFPVVGESEERGETGFRYPQQVVIGAAYRPTDRLLLELNVQWTDWSKYDDFQLRMPSGVISSPYDYGDTLLVGVGARYRVSDRVDLNAGYLYSTAAAPDRTYSPLVPDAPLHVFSLGIEGGGDSWKWSVALLYGHRESRSVEGSPVSPLTGVSSDGKWRTDGLSFLSGLTYRF